MELSEIKSVGPKTISILNKMGIYDDNDLREDICNNEIDFNDMVINVKDYDDNRVKVPKVVE